MRHYPVFVDLRARTIVVSGAGDVAVAKLRLLLKTEATIVVLGSEPAAPVRAWAGEGRIRLLERALEAGDAAGALLVYGANGDAAEDARAAEIGRAAGALVSIVDNLEDSDFITPAIVDRDPVTVAIGTEGAAPVLARRIKADVEAMLPVTLGLLARVAQGFRARVEALPSRTRRLFWTRFYEARGPQAIESGEAAVQAALEVLLAEGDAPQAGFVHLVGAGPGDPELLTLKARRLLHEADVVMHDQLVPPAILELARREATIHAVGKTGYGSAWKQEDINALLIAEARAGNRVVRLKGGDPAIFGRLDEETDALGAAGIGFSVVPGVTAASAAAAAIGQPLTQRRRNSAFRIITAHDVDGFAEQDWRALALPGSTAAIYMGLRATAFLRGRLLMHGAAPSTPVTAVVKASLPGQRILATTIVDLPETLAAAAVDGPAVLLYGLAPRDAAAVCLTIKEAL